MKHRETKSKDKGAMDKMKIILERSHFIINDAGVSEFEWYLEELSIPESDWENIDSIELDVAVLSKN